MARDGSGDFVLGFLFGAFVGAVLALLFAPAPGEDLRHQIHDKSIELKDRAGDLDLEDLRAKGQALLDEQKARLQEAIEEGKTAAARKKEELLAQLESAKPAGAPIELANKQG
jgi:gas vesicle protein